MSTENRHLPAGHARHPSAHRTPSAADGYSNGHREQPSFALESNEAGGFSHIIRSLPLVCGLTALAALLLSTAGATLALSAPDPVALIPLFARLALGVSSLLGGILAARRNPASPIAGGLTAGAAMALLSTIVGLCFGGEMTLTAWVVRACIVPVHLLGAYVARPRPRAPEHHAHTVGGHGRR